MDNFLKEKTESPKSTAPHIANVVTPEKKKVSFEQSKGQAENHDWEEKLEEVPTNVATDNRSAVECLKDQKHFVYLAINKTNPFQSIVEYGKGNKIKDVVDIQHYLIAFIAGIASAEAAADLKKHWESDLIIVETLEEQVLEGQSMLVQLAKKYPNLQIVVDWDNVERKQCLRTVMANIPDTSVLQPSLDIEHSNINITLEDTNNRAKNLEALGNLVMPFGKHIGKSYRQIVEVFPGYVEWAKTLTCPDAVLERLIKFSNWHFHGHVEPEHPQNLISIQKDSEPLKQQMCNGAEIIQADNQGYVGGSITSQIQARTEIKAMEEFHDITMNNQYNTMAVEAPVLCQPDKQVSSGNVNVLQEHPASQKDEDTGIKGMDGKFPGITNTMVFQAPSMLHGGLVQTPDIEKRQLPVNNSLEGGNDEVEYKGTKPPEIPIIRKRHSDALDGNCMKMMEMTLNPFNANKTSLVRLWHICNRNCCTLSHSCAD
jgi:hypothetical protein